MYPSPLAYKKINEFKKKEESVRHLLYLLAELNKTRVNFERMIIGNAY